MTTPDPMATGSGISGTADGSANIRRRTDLSDTPTPGDISAALYGPTPRRRDRYGDEIEDEPSSHIAPYTARPALPPALARRAALYWHERRRLRLMDREDVETIRDAALDELRRRAGR